MILNVKTEGNLSLFKFQRRAYGNARGFFVKRQIPQFFHQNLVQYSSIAFSQNFAIIIYVRTTERYKSQSKKIKKKLLTFKNFSVIINIQNKERGKEKSGSFRVLCIMRFRNKAPWRWGAMTEIPLSVERRRQRSTKIKKF